MRVPRRLPRGCRVRTIFGRCVLRDGLPARQRVRDRTNLREHGVDDWNRDGVLANQREMPDRASSFQLRRQRRDQMRSSGGAYGAGQLQVLQSRSGNVPSQRLLRGLVVQYGADRMRTAPEVLSFL